MALKSYRTKFLSGAAKRVESVHKKKVEKKDEADRANEVQRRQKRLDLEARRAFANNNPNPAVVFAAALLVGGGGVVGAVGGVGGAVGAVNVENQGLGNAAGVVGDANGDGAAAGGGDGVAAGGGDGAVAAGDGGGDGV